MIADDGAHLRIFISIFSCHLIRTHRVIDGVSCYEGVLLNLLGGFL